MSLIKKADVKNHLSARHRNEIHLYRPEGQQNTAAVAKEESAVADSITKDSVGDSLASPIPSGQEAASAAIASRPNGIAVVASSKSARP